MIWFADIIDFDCERVLFCL